MKPFNTESYQKLGRVSTENQKITACFVTESKVRTFKVKPLQELLLKRLILEVQAIYAMAKDVG